MAVLPLVVAALLAIQWSGRSLGLELEPRHQRTHNLNLAHAVNGLDQIKTLFYGEPRPRDTENLQVRNEESLDLDDRLTQEAWDKYRISLKDKNPINPIFHSREVGSGESSQTKHWKPNQAMPEDDDQPFLEKKPWTRQTMTAEEKPWTPDGELIREKKGWMPYQRPPDDVEESFLKSKVWTPRQVMPDVDEPPHETKDWTSRQAAPADGYEVFFSKKSGTSRHALPGDEPYLNLKPWTSQYELPEEDDERYLKPQRHHVKNLHLPNGYKNVCEKQKDWKCISRLPDDYACTITKTTGHKNLHNETKEKQEKECSVSSEACYCMATFKWKVHSLPKHWRGTEFCDGKCKEAILHHQSSNSTCRQTMRHQQPSNSWCVMPIGGRCTDGTNPYSDLL